MALPTARVARFALVLALAAAGTAAGCGRSSGSGPPRAPSAAAGARVLAPSTAAATAQGRVSAPAVSVGDTVEVLVDLPATGTEVYGAGFDLRYDPGVLEFLDVRAGGLLAGAEARSALLGGRAGVAVVAITKEGPVPGDAGPGRLLVLRLKALSAGQSPLEFARGLAVDGAGLSRPLVLAALSVAVR